MSDWISVDDRMPEEHDTIYAKRYEEGTQRKWMYRKQSDQVIVCGVFENGKRFVDIRSTHDGVWGTISLIPMTITHWMPLPPPPEHTPTHELTHECDSLTHGCDGDVDNEPLTLEEMKLLDGEPVWTVTIGDDEPGRWELCSRKTLCACPFFEVLCCVAKDGEVTDCSMDTYGKTWLAFRHKPKEG